MLDVRVDYVLGWGHVTSTIISCISTVAHSRGVTERMPCCWR